MCPFEEQKIYISQCQESFILSSSHHRHLKGNIHCCIDVHKDGDQAGWTSYPNYILFIRKHTRCSRILTSPASQSRRWDQVNERLAQDLEQNKKEVISTFQYRPFGTRRTSLHTLWHQVNTLLALSRRHAIPDKISQA